MNRNHIIKTYSLKTALLSIASACMLTTSGFSMDEDKDFPKNNPFNNIQSENTESNKDIELEEKFQELKSQFKQAFSNFQNVIFLSAQELFQNNPEFNNLEAPQKLVEGDTYDPIIQAKKQLNAAEKNFLEFGAQYFEQFGEKVLNALKEVFPKEEVIVLRPYEDPS